jgi:hypothetical protein
VIAIAANALVSGFDPTPEITATRDPEVVMDTAPAAVGGGQQTISLYQSDRIALKMRMPVAWALRASSAIAWMNTVSW